MVRMQRVFEEMSAVWDDGRWAIPARVAMGSPRPTAKRVRQRSANGFAQCLASGLDFCWAGGAE
eukprot:3803794-Lingulodinium_polyedra.AAC.1